MQTDADKPPAEKDFGEEMLKLQEKAIKAKMVSQVFGVDANPAAHAAGPPAPAAPAPQTESLAATVVTKSMSVLEETNKQYKDLADQNAKRMEAAISDRDSARADALAQQMAAIKDGYGKLETALADLKKGSQGGFVDQIKQARAILTEIQEMAGARQPATPPTPVMSPDLQLRILEIQQAHELAMKKIDLEIGNANRDWDLKLMEFRDTRSARDREYEDKKRQSEQTMGGFQDIIAGFAGGLTQEREAEAGIAHSAPAKAAAQHAESAEEPVLNVSVASFPCQFCQETVPITPGNPKAICPQCSAEYTVGQPGG